jgi:uncharacterized protein
VDEAVPYEEFKQNPYTVHCSTSLGGHLAWFEIGGSRWFSRPVRLHELLAILMIAKDCQIENFFSTLANADFEKDQAESKRPNVSPDSQILTRYEPMRRKLTILPA